MNTLEYKNLQVYIEGFLIDWLILTGCQPIKSYFKPRG